MDRRDKRDSLGGMKALPILFVLMMLAAAARADNVVTLVDGRELKNIWLLDVTYETIVIWHDGKQEEIAHTLLRYEDRAKLQERIDEAKAAEQRFKDGLEAKRKRGGKFTTQSGVHYEQVALVEAKTDEIVIQHEGGVAHIPLTDLPDVVKDALKGEIAGAKMVQEARERLLEKERGNVEWARAQGNAKAMAAHSLSGSVMEVKSEGVLIARVTYRPDITPGLYAFVEGVTGKKVGASFTGQVKRAGVYTDIGGKTFPKYRLASK